MEIRTVEENGVSFIEGARPRHGCVADRRTRAPEASRT